MVLTADDSAEAALCSLVREMLSVADQFRESRGFQSFQVALAGRRLRKEMFGNLKCRHRFAAVEPTVEKYLVQGAPQNGDRGGIMAHAPAYSPCP
jgi:hypothetical protein